MKALACACALLLAAGAIASARPKPPAAPPPPDPNACMPNIAVAEKKYQLPDQLLGTIAMVESGQPDPVTSRMAPWPWAINAQGVGYFLPTKAEAMAAVAEFQAAGVQSIDVGCMQINLLYHPAAFASLEEAFDPAANTLYGARFLSALYRQTGNWPQAAAAYHSQTPEIGQGYESKVMALWPLASQFPDPGPPPPGPGSALGPALGAKHDNRPEDNVLTPEFAARTRQIDEDLARLAATFGPILKPDAAKGGTKGAPKGASVKPASLRGGGDRSKPLSPREREQERGALAAPSPSGLEPRSGSRPG